MVNDLRTGIRPMFFQVITGELARTGGQLTWKSNSGEMIRTWRDSPVSWFSVKDILKRERVDFYFSFLWNFFNRTQNCFVKVWKKSKEKSVKLTTTRSSRCRQSEANQRRGSVMWRIVEIERKNRLSQNISDGRGILPNAPSIYSGSGKLNWIRCQ